MRNQSSSNARQHGGYASQLPLFQIAELNAVGLSIGFTDAEGIENRYSELLSAVGTA